ncbi:MAG TPA: STAS domain-containing protein [Phototrophicaceae bacterium]|nr:STAS domain-containing protein [Phototrophicaceae bacterium]
MAFESNLEMQGSVAKITLEGELDASVAQILRDRIEEASNQHAKKLALLMEKLDYMSSAGLRTLVFAKQKMGSGVTIYLVGAQPAVSEAIRQTGFHHSVIMLPAYDAAVIEA